MLHLGLYWIPQTLRHFPKGQGLWCKKAQRNVSHGESFRRLTEYFNSDESAQEINDKFALPYVDLNDLRNNMHQKLDSRTTTSCLLKSSYNGQMHHPAIPMKYIMSHVDEVDRNIQNRKIGAGIDLKRDIVSTYSDICSCQNINILSIR